MVCSSCGNNEAMYCARCFHSSSGRTAENTVGTQPTDVQQLKVSIALLKRWIGVVRETGISPAESLISETNAVIAQQKTV
jgi:hypothetical protein